MTESKSPRMIGWKVASLTESVASVRYRAMLPLLGLEEAGFRCRLFSDAKNVRLDDLDVLVIVKGFSADDLALVQTAVAHGVPVVLDLCDNIFIPKYGTSPVLGHIRTSPAKLFLAMARLCDSIVVSTEPLAEVLRKRLDARIAVHVIPDGLESPALLEQMRSRLSVALKEQKNHQTTMSRLRTIRQRVRRALGQVRSMRGQAVVSLAGRVVRRLAREMQWQRFSERPKEGLRRMPVTTSPNLTAQRKALVVDPDVKRVLWFGNHGEPYANFGILDLLEIREALETLANELKVELVVVSNHSEKFERYIRPFAMRSSYLDWDLETLLTQLSLASVVVVPNSLDEFSICKSANRTISALQAGVPVVATATPALGALKECIATDDFLGGLRLYLTDKARADSDVAKGRDIIAREFGQAAITTAWVKVIDRALLAEAQVPPDAELFVALNIAQDLDMALPIIVSALQEGVSVVACCNAELLKKSPRSIELLQKEQVSLLVLPKDFSSGHPFEFPPSAKMLLTAGESNLGPHRFSRALTDAANKKGLFTATLQHGFENIGLTYDDEFHAADKIDFAAQRIYLWGGLETLHPKVSGVTRQKCVPMGCPKPARVPKADLGDLLQPFKTVIGVFENLHWTRYSDDYRTFFLQGVEALARRFPEVLFLVKPHHAGKWLTTRYEGATPSATNIVVADPQSALWEPYTAPSLMGHLHAIITSPSTVALDGARQNLPVAVVSHQMNLQNYEPLFLIRAATDWEQFVRNVLSPESRGGLVEHGKNFLSGKLLPEGADLRIVQDLLECSSLQNGAQH